MAAGAVVATLVAGCSSSGYDSTHDDTGYDTRDFATPDIIIMPDGYPNVATKCVVYQPGKRLYVTTRSNGFVAVELVDDPACVHFTGDVRNDPTYQPPAIPGRVVAP